MSPPKIVHIEDKYPSVKQLIELGKHKKFLLYDEIYEVLPDEVIGLPDEVDEIYRRFDQLTIWVLDRPERYVNREEIEAARDLGASAAGAWWRVTLPLSWGGVFAAFALTFIIAGGDYVTPQLVGGTSGGMIGRSIASTFGTAFNWPLGAALSFLTLAFVLVLLGGLRFASGRIVR